MASDVKKPKGILKASSSFDKPDHPHHNNKEMKWDEMNIMATHHPPGKDYGHMKIDEPKTPYSKLSDAEDDDDEGNRRHSVSEEPGIDPESIASRLQKVEDSKAKAQLAEENESSSEEEIDETEEERAKRKLFEQKRKLHYNEFQAVKLAKQLMEEEDEDEEDETTDNSNTEDKNSNEATSTTNI